MDSGEAPPPWHHWLGQRMDWLAASAISTLAVTLAYHYFVYAREPVTPLMMLGMAALPVGCLIVRPSVLSMVGLTLAGCPCFLSATMFCDGSPSQSTNGVLHATEMYLIYIPIYGFARALHLALFPK